MIKRFGRVMGARRCINQAIVVGSIGLVLGCASFRNVKSVDDEAAFSTWRKTRVHVVELSNLRFEASSFFDERRNQSFEQIRHEGEFASWAQEAIDRVNRYVPPHRRLDAITLRLMFHAEIRSGVKLYRQVPLSMIESYQEPKTASIRLGMLELKESKESFQLTVAHEYAHLVCEHASRASGSTPVDAESSPFWPKSVYEGVADFLMSVAMDSPYTAEPGTWSARDLRQFRTRAEARSARDTTIPKATKAFREMGLIPKYPIYEDWLKKVSGYIQSLGGIDPYAEGTWLAGELVKSARSPSRALAMVDVILALAAEGTSFEDAETFLSEVLVRAGAVP